MLRGVEQDSSKILIDYFTEAQKLAQNVIDKALRDPKSPNGELLVLIPFRDRWDLTSECLGSLAGQVCPETLRLKVILIDNRSTADETKIGIQTAQSKFPSLHIEVLPADFAFNFSRLNNEGFCSFKTAATRWVLFLNNDVVLGDKTILAKMTTCLETIPEAGAVGCTLLYANRRIQHLFAAPGVKIIAAHPLKGTLFNPNMEWFLKSARPVAAVTGAALMTRAVDFEKVGLFDERLPNLGQDIVLCTRLESLLEKFNVVVSTGDVFHHESLTKAAVFPGSEIEYIYKQYSEGLKSQNYYSPKLSRWSERPLVHFGLEGEYPVSIAIKSCKKGNAWVEK